VITIASGGHLEQMTLMSLPLLTTSSGLIFSDIRVSFIGNMLLANLMNSGSMSRADRNGLRFVASSVGAYLVGELSLEDCFFISFTFMYFFLCELILLFLMAISMVLAGTGAKFVATTCEFIWFLRVIDYARDTIFDDWPEGSLIFGLILIEAYSSS
jgi:hypothetical protein